MCARALSLEIGCRCEWSVILFLYVGTILLCSWHVGYYGRPACNLCKTLPMPLTFPCHICPLHICIVASLCVSIGHLGQPNHSGRI